MWHFIVRFESLLVKDHTTGVQYGLDANWVFWGYYSRRSLLTVHDRFKGPLSGHRAYVTIFKGPPPNYPAPGMELYYKDDAKIPDLYRLLQNIIH